MGAHALVLVAHLMVLFTVRLQPLHVLETAPTIEAVEGAVFHVHRKLVSIVLGLAGQQHFAQTAVERFGGLAQLGVSVPMVQHDSGVEGEKETLAAPVLGRDVRVSAHVLPKLLPSRVRLAAQLAEMLMLVQHVLLDVGLVLERQVAALALVQL